MPDDARSAVLGAIRDGIGAPRSQESVEAEWAAIPRDYDRAQGATAQQVRELFAERLRDYDAHVSVCSTIAVPSTIAQRLRLRGAQRLLVPQGFAAEHLPSGFAFVLERGLTYLELSSFDGILTAATVAIAETGTIVLQNTPGQGGRAATLLPDYHLCLVRSSQIVRTVPESFALLRPRAELPTTFVSGPSATADIEMTRIKGVHGPRFLDVILITD